MMHQDLEFAGELLYGAKWKMRLAEELGFTRAGMAKWEAAGIVPEYVRPMLIKLLEDRQTMIRLHLDELRSGPLAR